MLIIAPKIQSILQLYIIVYTKSVLWEYNYDNEYLEEFYKGKYLKYSLLLAVFKVFFLEKFF